MFNLDIMEFNKKNSQIFFIIIFLGYIFYSLALYIFNIPAVFGGFFGLFTSICSLIFIFTIFSSLNYFYLASKFTFFLSLICFIFALITTITSFIYPDLKYAVIQSFEMLVFWVALQNLGFYFILSYKGKVLNLSFLLCLVFLIFTINYIMSEGKFMLPFGTRDIENENVSGYQGISRNFLIISIFIVAYLKKSIVKYFFTIILGVLLFLIGSRSEFYAFLFCILCYEFLLILRVRGKFIFIFIFISLLVVLFFIFNNFITSSRQFNVFNINSDESWLLRQQMKDFALIQINNNPILGEFGGHLRFHANNTVLTGSYAHNALSGYVNYGVIFFLCYMILNFYNFIYSAVMIFKNPKNSDWIFTFFLTSIVLFLVILAKPVFWPITYLSWGVFLGTLYKSKRYQNLKLETT